MLPVSRISDIAPYSEDWFSNRLGRITSSPVSCLCAPKGIGAGGMTYLRNKVYEAITGQSSERNISTEATIWGVENEPKSIAYWKNNTPECHRLLTDQHLVIGERFSSTPDALVFMNSKLMFCTDEETGEETLNCETLETKSYMTPSVHMAHVECETAEDIKRINSDLYWQCISQIQWANVTQGRAIFFHPDFPDGHDYKMGEVIFSKVTLRDEFKFFNTRMQEAETIFNKLLNYKKPIKD